MSSTFRQALVVGGEGAVGALLLRSLAADGARRLWSLDLREPSSGAGGVRRLAGDVRALDRDACAALAGSDLVVLAVPHSVALESIGDLTAQMAPGALLVDTLSVKSAFLRKLDALDAPIEVLSINPMFAPDLGFTGRSVLAVERRAGPLAARFEALLEAWGSVISKLSADQHDRRVAAWQAATHAALLAFGAALCRMETNVSEATSAAPPPHRAMLAMLARMCGNDVEVYRDVQTENEHANEARRSLVESLATLQAAIAASSPSDFARLFEGIERLLGTSQPALAETCRRMFEALERPA